MNIIVYIYLKTQIYIWILNGKGISLVVVYIGSDFSPLFLTGQYNIGVLLLMKYFGSCFKFFFLLFFFFLYIIVE